MSNNIIYGYVTPQLDPFDPWLFTGAHPESALSVLAFPGAVTVYADSLQQCCQVVSENG
jgi:hypothetical protein